MRLPTLRGAIIRGRFTALRAEHPGQTDRFIFAMVNREETQLANR